MAEEKARLPAGQSASLSFGLFGNLNAWPEGMVTHQTFCPLFVATEKPYHQLCLHY